MFNPTRDNNLTNQKKYLKIDDAVIFSFKMYSVSVKT